MWWTTSQQWLSNCSTHGRNKPCTQRCQNVRLALPAIAAGAGAFRPQLSRLLLSVLPRPLQPLCHFWQRALRNCRVWNDGHHVQSPLFCPVQARAPLPAAAVGCVDAPCACFFSFWMASAYHFLADRRHCCCSCLVAYPERCLFGFPLLMPDAALLLCVSDSVCAAGEAPACAFPQTRLQASNITPCGHSPLQAVGCLLGADSTAPFRASALDVLGVVCQTPAVYYQVFSLWGTGCSRWPHRPCWRRADMQHSIVSGLCPTGRCGVSTLLVRGQGLLTSGCCHAHTLVRPAFCHRLPPLTASLRRHA